MSSDVAQTVSRNKNLILAYLRAREDRNLHKLEEILSDDFMHFMLDRLQDRQGLLDEVRDTFMQGSFQVDALVEEGNHVACRYRFSGVHTSGNEVAFSGMFIARIVKGRIAGGWGEYDAARVKQQLSS